jgi:hypothetical protein
VGDTVGIQIQLVTGVGFLWPTEIAPIEQRYSDAPPARLRTLTAAGFAAAKLATWMERHAPRDLYDLWALGERGLVDAEAVDVFVRLVAPDPRGPRPPHPRTTPISKPPPPPQVRRAALPVSTIHGLHALNIADIASSHKGGTWPIRYSVENAGSSVRFVGEGEGPSSSATSEPSSDALPIPIRIDPTCW